MFVYNIYIFKSQFSLIILDVIISKRNKNCIIIIIIINKFLFSFLIIHSIITNHNFFFLNIYLLQPKLIAIFEKYRTETLHWIKKYIVTIIFNEYIDKNLIFFFFNETKHTQTQTQTPFK